MNKKAVVLILTGVILLTACNVNTDRTDEEKNSTKAVEEIFSNEYVTLQYADGAVTETEWEYGHYKPAWIDEFAVYPEEGEVP